MASRARRYCEHRSRRLFDDVGRRARRTRALFDETVRRFGVARCVCSEEHDHVAIGRTQRGILSNARWVAPLLMGLMATGCVLHPDDGAETWPAGSTGAESSLVPSTGSTLESSTEKGELTEGSGSGVSPDSSGANPTLSGPSSSSETFPSSAPTSSEDTQTGEGPENLLLLLESDPAFSQLTAAIQRAKFEPELRKLEQRTFLAPSNAAFDAMDPKLKAEIFADEARLVALLRNHLLEGRVVADELSAGARRTLAGYPLMGRVSPDGMPILQSGGSGMVRRWNLSAKNGMLQGIDGVLTVPRYSLLELTQTHPQLSSFFAAASGSELNDLLNDESSGVYTLYAPHNQAFAALAQRMGAAAYAELMQNKTEISQVIRQHLHPELLGADEAFAPKDVESLEPGKPLRFRRQGTFAPPTVNGRGFVNAVGTDVVAKNGILHAMDGTLHDGP